MQFSKKVLLTGAGFTHNFGTPLSSEMWSKIFNNNNVQKHQRLKELLLDYPNYEDAYHEVLNGKYTSVEKKDFLNATTFAYEHIDEIIRNFRFTGDSLFPNIYGVQEFVNNFSEENDINFIFTVNQDLFLERKYYNGKKPNLPGITLNRNWFSTHFNKKLTDTDLIQLPNEKEFDLIKDKLLSVNQFYYIKLHGSYNWVSSGNDRRMVIGLNKENEINREPLLRYYYKLFQQVLNSGNVMLMAVGYGFGDSHINKVISEAIIKSGLKIYVITPISISEFKENLLRQNYRQQIVSALSSYFPYTLTQIYPGSQDRTVYENEIHEKYFNKQV